MTWLGLQTSAVRLLRTIAKHDESHDLRIKHDKPINERQKPLIASHRQNNFENYWKLLYMELHQNRVDFMCKNIFPSLNIPYEIWNLILEFELIHPIHDIINEYQHNIQQSLNTIYIVPYSFGFIQFTIVGFILSGFYETVIHYLYPQGFDFYLRISGIVLIFTSLIQIIFCLYSVYINYTQINIIQLSKLKQSFYQKRRAIGNKQRHVVDISVASASSDSEHKTDRKDHETFALLLLEHTNVNTLDCSIEYAPNNNEIEWRAAQWHRLDNNAMSVMTLQPWELLISAQKWCNLFYVQNILYFKRHYTLETNRSAIAQPNIWFIVSKPLYVFVLGVQLVTLSSFVVLLWIPFSALLVFLVWRCVFNMSFYVSLGWSLFVCCMVFWEVTSKTHWTHSSLDTATDAAVAAFQEIFLFIAAYSLVFLCQKSHKILVCGVWPAWILSYVVLSVEPYLNPNKNKYCGCILNLLSLYCLYISAQFMLFCIPKQHKLRLFSNTKFIICCWLFGWLDVQSFHALYHSQTLDLLPSHI